MTARALSSLINVQANGFLVQCCTPQQMCQAHIIILEYLPVTDFGMKSLKVGHFEGMKHTKLKTYICQSNT